MADSKFSDEDDQAFTMQKITDMLIAAGYFRARVSGLNVFDRIVGGMSWGITASGVPVEVDVNFKENANIGEKILISEQLVEALIQMKCPFELKPHQIQGLKLNCKPLFPIIQWLVKSVIDYRRITGDIVRNYSNFLFDSWSMDEDQNYLDQHSKDNGREFLINNVSSNYALTRKYSKQQSTRFNSRQNYVDATLMEYGFNFRAHIAFGQSDVDLSDKLRDRNTSYPQLNESKKGHKAPHNKISEKYGDLMNKMEGNTSKSITPKKSDAKRNEMDENIETAEEEEKRLKSIRGEMTEQETSKMSNVSGSALVEIIDRDAVESGATNYNKQQMADTNDLGNNLEFMYNERKKRLEERYKELSAYKKLRIEQYKQENEKMEEMEGGIQTIVDKNAKIEAIIKQLEQKEEKIENKELLARLKALVQQNESVKREQDIFKKECKKQQELFRHKLSSLDEIEEDDEEIARIKKIENLYRNDLKKYDKIRGLLAGKNQEMSRVSRKLESYPMRSELLQYEKRFVELYNLTNERLKETKKYFHLYNSLNDSHESMKSEVALLQQIQTEFPKRSSNSEDRSEFIKSMDKMIQSLKTNCENGTTKLQTVKNDKDEQSAKYNELLNYQRKYYKYVKEFQNACNINSQLSDRIDIIEAQIKEPND